MRPLAALALALLCGALLPGVAVAARWARPVPGDVARPFHFGADPFRAGQHRGADLEAPPGTAVRSACAGRVRFAGRVAGEGRVVSVRCGRWRVSYVGLGELSVRAGERVRARERLGRASGPSAGHEGLHLGVRREGARFGYVDPLRFLGSAPPAPPPPLAPVPRRVPRTSAPAPSAAPVLAAPAAAPGVAPWLVWAGLALVLAGAAGSGYARRSGPSQRRQPSCPVSSTSSSSPTTPIGR